MQAESLWSFLLWCTIINYAILVLWFAVLIFAKNFLYGLHSKWFNVTRDTLDAINYGSMAIYKIGIILLNLVPLIALSVLY